MINVNQITAQMARMSDQALQQFAAMHKADPYTLSLALSESNRRKEMRQGAQMGQQQPQPKVVDQEIAQMGPQMTPQQGMPQGMPPQQLPENVGIGQLPAPNMKGMAEGGIVAFDEGGEVPGYAGGVFTGSDPFDDAFRRVMRYEGGYVANDAGKGPSKFGINKAANPDLDIAKLTEKDAKRIYRERYWDKISGDELAKKNPALATVAFDTAVNMGVAPAKKLVEQSGGDPSKILAAREQHYASLVEKDPKKFAPYQSGWQSRLADLATSLFPAAAAAEVAPAVAQAGTPAATGVQSLVDKIPGQSGAVPEPTKTRPLTGNERLVGGAETALQYGTGLLAIPTAGAYSLYRKAMYGEDPTANFEKYASQVTYEPRSSGGPEMSQGFAQTLSDLKLPPYLAHLGVQGPRSASGINTLTKDQRVAMAADAAARAAELKKQAELTRLEAPKPPVGATGEPMVQTEKGIMPKSTYDSAEQLWRDRQQAAKADTFAQQLDALAKKAPEDAPAVPAAKEPMVPERARAVAASQASPGFNKEFNDFNMGKGLTALLPEEFGKDVGQMPVETPSPKEIKEIGKEATPKSERKGMSGEDFLMIGLGILSGQSPHALTNIGEGGLKGLQMVQAGRKNEAEAAYRDAMSKYYAAGAEAIERGAKDKDLVGAAEKAAHDAFTAMAKDNVFLMTNPEERAKLYNRLRMEKFMQYGISPTMLGSGPSAGGQPRFLGFEKASPE